METAERPALVATLEGNPTHDQCNFKQTLTARSLRPPGWCLYNSMTAAELLAVEMSAQCAFLSVAAIMGSHQHPF